MHFLWHSLSLNKIPITTYPFNNAKFYKIQKYRLILQTNPHKKIGKASSMILPLLCSAILL